MTKEEYEAQQAARQKQFDEAYAKFKSGEGSAPIVYKELNIKVNEGGKEVVLSVEEIDRDGETVLMDGMRLQSWIKENGIPLIDSHNSYSSVTTNGLGALRNPRIEIRDGKKALVCDPDFAPTPHGNIAKILYMGVDGGKPYFTNVSMGFVVYDYDNATRAIKEWEPFEGSLVTVGANMGARFRDKAAGAAVEVEDTEEQIAKNLARFKQIHEPFKEFTKTFLSDEFCKTIGYTKDGDLLVDIMGVFDTVSRQFEKTAVVPPVPVEAPQEHKKISVSADAVAEAISHKLEQLIS